MSAMSALVSERIDPIDEAIAQLKAAKQLPGMAGGNMHLVCARNAIERTLNDWSDREQVETLEGYSAATQTA